MARFRRVVSRLARALPTVLVVLAARAPETAAQVNIEALRPTELPAGRSGSFGGRLTVRTGNVDFVQLDLEGRHNVVRDGVTTLIIGNGGIGLLGRSRFSSSGLFHFRRTHEWLAWLSPEWYAQANYDRAYLLRFRVVVGGGARTGVARGDWGELGAGTALMLEHERLALPDTARCAPQARPRPRRHHRRARLRGRRTRARRRPTPSVRGDLEARPRREEDRQGSPRRSHSQARSPTLGLFRLTIGHAQQGLRLCPT